MMWIPSDVDLAASSHMDPWRLIRINLINILEFFFNNIPTTNSWCKGSEAPHNHHILVKKLARVGVHTYIGMLGYCVKDKGEDHF